MYGRDLLPRPYIPLVELIDLRPGVVIGGNKRSQLAEVDRRTLFLIIGLGLHHASHPFIGRHRSEIEPR